MSKQRSFSPVQVAAAGGGLSRRAFLLRTLGLTATGLAAGGLGAWAYTQTEATEAAQNTVRSLGAQVSGLQTRSDGLQTLAGELQSQLTAAMQQNAELATALSAAQQERDGLQARLAETESSLAETESSLAATQAGLARYQALTGLYDQLESAGLDEAARSGLAALNGALAVALGAAPALTGGLAQARAALAGFEQFIPQLETAQAWLAEQALRLKVGLAALEIAARNYLPAAAAGAAAVFGGFAAFMLDHLPFNIGQGVRSTLAAAQEVVAGAGAAVAPEGLEARLLLPLNPLLGQGPLSWRAALLAPVRDQALARADELLAAVEAAGRANQEALQAPLSAVLEQRAGLREQIAAYRAQHGL